MNWHWLSGPVVVLIGLIASIITIGIFVVSVARWLRALRTKAPAVQPAPAPAVEQRRMRTNSDLQVFLPPSGVHVLKLHEYNGGAVPTSSVVDTGSYMAHMTFKPVTDTDCIARLQSVLAGPPPA